MKPTKALLFSGLVLTILLILLGGLYYWASQEEKRQTEVRFQRNTEEYQQRLKVFIEVYSAALQSLELLISSNPDLTEQEFIDASVEVISKYPVFSGLEWAPKVYHEDREAFVESMCTVGHPDYEIVNDISGSEGVFRKATPAEVYYPIIYIEPSEKYEPVLGFNLLGGESSRLLNKSLNSRAITMSSISKLYQKEKPLPIGFVVYYPVRAVGKSSNGDSSGELGILVGLFELDLLVAPGKEQIFDLLIFDYWQGENRAPDTIFIQDGNIEVKFDWEDNQLQPAKFRQIHTIDIWEKQWDFHFTPTPAWLQKQNSHAPEIILALGGGGSLLLAWIVFFHLRNTERIRLLVQERTRDLESTQSQLKSELKQRKQLTEELVESRRRLEDIMTYLPGLVVRFLCDDQLTIQYLSRGMLAVPTSFQESPKGWLALIAEEDRDRSLGVIQTSARNNQPFEFECRMSNKEGDGSILLVRGHFEASRDREDSGIPIATAFAIDISDRIKAEGERELLHQKMLEAQKLESLGVMASGIAHDFNNLLTSIMGHGNLIVKRLPEDSPLQNELQFILQASRSAADMCRHLLSFSGEGSFSEVVFNLNKVVRDMVELLEISTSKKARLQLEFESELPQIRGDISQFRQVLMNLVINGAEAIDHPQGIILIQTEWVAVEKSWIQQAMMGSDRPAGRYVKLVIQDNGSGMDPDTLNQIFEPFFSTKFTGRGLGLASVLGILNSHGAIMHLESEPGEGTRFTLLFEGTEEPATESLEHIEPAGADSSFPKRLLLIDDEAFMRRVCKGILEDNQIESVLAEDGESGLQTFRESPDEIELAIIDMTMPGISGLEVAETLKSEKPELPIILMSGYSKDRIIDENSLKSGIFFLEKPFQAMEFESMIRRAFSYKNNAGE